MIKSQKFNNMGVFCFNLKKTLCKRKPTTLFVDNLNK